VHGSENVKKSCNKPYFLIYSKNRKKGCFVERSKCQTKTPMPKIKEKCLVGHPIFFVATL
jgi:hypothetical protein